MQDPEFTENICAPQNYNYYLLKGNAFGNKMIKEFKIFILYLFLDG